MRGRKAAITRPTRAFSADPQRAAIKHVPGTAVGPIPAAAHAREHFLEEQHALARGGAPAYHQLSQLMRERILAGQFPVGAQLPTEDEMMRAFGLGRHTVRAAIHALVIDGLVERFPGRGTFVRARTGAAETWAARSLEDMLDRSFRGDVTVLGISRIEARTDPDAAISLRADSVDQLFRVELLRSEEGLPLTLVTTDLPMEFARRLPPDLEPQLRTTRLLHIVEASNAVRVAKVRQIAGACNATPEVARLLRVEAGEALLSLRNIYLDATDRPVETSFILCHPRRHRHIVELYRSG